MDGFGRLLGAEWPMERRGTQRFECAKRPDFQLWIDAYNGKPEWKKIFTHPDGDKFYKVTCLYMILNVLWK